MRDKSMARKGGILLMAAWGGILVASGCSVPKPRPSTWWGVRHVRNAFNDDERRAEENRGFRNKNIQADTNRPPPPREMPEDSDFTRAVKMVREHRFAEAKRLLLDVIDKHPRHAESYRWLGDCYYNLLELPEAIEAYTRARDLDPSNYFALRGKGFAHLHYGHQKWNERDYDGAHDMYRRALEILQQCLRLYPADSESMYGRAMAAEGATRKLYANAVRLKRAGRDAEAEVVARNCLEVIEEGIRAANFRINAHLEEIGPRALAGGLWLRRGMLWREFGETERAVADLRKAADVQQSILDEIDQNNVQARHELEKCRGLIETWETEARS